MIAFVERRLSPWLYFAGLYIVGLLFPTLAFTVLDTHTRMLPTGFSKRRAPSATKTLTRTCGANTRYTKYEEIPLNEVEGKVNKDQVLNKDNLQLN